MTEKPASESRFRGALIVVLVMLVAFGVYYFFYVRGQGAYFVARNLRLVGTIAAQLDESLQLRSRRAKQTASLTVATLSTEEQEEVFRPVCQQTYLREFEDVVIANEKGHVVHNCKRATGVVSLEQLQVKEGWRDAKALPFAALQRSSRHTRTYFGGSSYRVFSHPLQIGDKSQANWVVAGFLSDARFNKESLTISYTLLIGVLAVLILAVLALPFLRIGLIGELQRVRLTDVLLLGICTLFGVAVLTIVLLDAVGYQLMRRVGDKQLRHLASDLKRHMLDEIQKSEKVLDELDQLLPADLAGREPLQGAAYGSNSVQSYPFFESFYRIDRKGMQIAKRSIGPKTTDLVNVSTRSYFVDARDGRYTKGQYAIESIFSINTASAQATVAKLSGHYRANDPDTPMVSAVTFPMRSLVNPVIVAGYKFAVIDREGNVLFHSDAQRNTFENFFEETDRNRSVRAAVFGRQNELMNFRYWGTDHRGFVTPVEGTDWTLVTFRNKRLIRAINVETIVIAVMFLVVYALGYALVLATIAVVRPSYRAPWVWFDKEHVYDYRRLIYSYMGFAAALAGSIYLFKPRPLVVVAFLTPVMASLVTYIRLKRRAGILAKTAGAMLLVCYVVWLRYAFFDNLVKEPKHIEPDVVINSTAVMVLVVLAGTAGILMALLPPWRVEGSRPDVRRHLLVPGYAYGWAATLLIAVISILPTAAFFKAAFKIETESFAKYGQVDLIEKFGKRWDELQQRKAKLIAEAVEMGRPELIGRVNTLARRRHNDGLDLYYRFFFGTKLLDAKAETAQNKAAQRTWSLFNRVRMVKSDPTPVPGLLERLLPHYSNESEKMRELLHSESSDNEQWKWDRHGDMLVFAPAEWPGRRHVLVRTKASRVFDIHWLLKSKSFSPLTSEPVLHDEPDTYDKVESKPDDLGWTLKMGILLFGVIAYLATIIGAVRFVNKRVFLVDVVEPLWLKPGETIGPALGGNLLIFTNDVRRTLTKVARDSFIRVSAEQFAESPADVFWRRLMSRIDLEPAGKGLLIADFDAEWDDEIIRMGLLRFVEIATTVHHRHVMILTRTSPWVLFGEIEKAEAIRWSAILASFTVRIDDGLPSTEPVKPAPNYGKPLGQSYDELVALLQRTWTYLRNKEEKQPVGALIAGVAQRIGSRLMTAATSTAKNMDVTEYINGSDKHTAALIDRECFANPFLVQLGEELKAQKSVRGEEQLYDEIGERAASYYSTLWSRCSSAEKVVLQHLAEDGFANVKDRQTLRRLLARGVIRRQPHFELMNETFRRFVIAAPRRREVEVIHTRVSVSTWDKIEKPLMAGLCCAAVFFVATQRELFDVTMTTVTAVATGIPTLVRVAGYFADPRALIGIGRS